MCSKYFYIYNISYKNKIMKRKSPYFGEIEVGIEDRKKEVGILWSLCNNILK